MKNYLAKVSWKLFFFAFTLQWTWPVNFQWKCNNSLCLDEADRNILYRPPDDTRCHTVHCKNETMNSQCPFCNQRCKRRWDSFSVFSFPETLVKKLCVCCHKALIDFALLKAMTQWVALQLDIQQFSGSLYCCFLGLFEKKCHALTHQLLVT